AAGLALDLLHRIADHGDDPMRQVEAALGAVGVDLAAGLGLLRRGGRHVSSRPRRSRRASFPRSLTETWETTSGFGSLPLPSVASPASDFLAAASLGMKRISVLISKESLVRTLVISSA